MDTIILPSGREYSAKYAAGVIGTPLFNALIVGESDVVKIVTDLSGVQTFTVKSPYVSDTVYEGYTQLIRLHRHTDGYLVTLSKEAEDG